MAQRICIIQGHPTPGGGHLCHALAEAYRDGAAAGGHEIRQISVADLAFPLLHSKDDWDKSAPPPSIADAQRAIQWSTRLVIFYPLWLGGMPALLKGFLEQTLRPGFALEPGMKPLLKDKSARIVVTMGMPALAYRWWFGALTLRSLEQNILAFVGITPSRHTLIGMVESLDAKRVRRLLGKMRNLGRRGW